MPDDRDAVSLQGAVEVLDGSLALKIPLEYAAGLIECSRGISEVRDEHLVILIPNWLAQKLTITEGSEVIVDNYDGKFNIRPAVGPN